MDNVLSDFQKVVRDLKKLGFQPDSYFPPGSKLYTASISDASGVLIEGRKDLNYEELLQFYSQFLHKLNTQNN